MTTRTQLQFTLAELTRDLDVVIQGDPACLVQGVSTIQEAKPGHISFLTNSLYKKYLPSTQAAAVILNPTDAESCPVNAVITSQPHYIYSCIAMKFDRQPTLDNGVHPSAVIGEDSDIHSDVKIGPGVVVGRRVKLAQGVVIGAGSVIGDDVEIGEGSQIDARVTIYYGVKIGKLSRIASGAVIGSEGFGFANHKGKWHKVAQLGSVRIGDEVDIGANTTIDRGAVEDTVIENGVKLDNQIQIGHNVRIGENTIIAGCAGIAGSVTIGKNCMIGGSTNFAGHITIGDNVMITATTGVSKSIKKPGVYSSGIVGAVPTLEFKKNNARFYRLEKLIERVKQLELLIKSGRDAK